MNSMSYGIYITGGSSDAHNKQVKEIVDAATAKLEALAGAYVRVEGYSEDLEGRIDLGHDTTKDA